MAVYVNAVSTTTRSLSLLCPGVTDNRGKTPLDLAVKWNKTEVINYLQTLSTPEPGVCVCVYCTNMVWQLCVHNSHSCTDCMWSELILTVCVLTACVLQHAVFQSVIWFLS